MPRKPQKPLYDLLDWSRYIREIRDVFQPDTMDLEDAIAMAQVAVRQWAQRDFELCLARQMRIDGVERPFKLDVSEGTIDLVLAFPDRSFMVVDWKSSYNLSGEKLANWERRLRLSWQHSIYARSLGAPADKVCFEYRGVSRKMECVSLPLKFEERDFQRAYWYLSNTDHVIHQLDTSTRVLDPGGPWPKNKPQACGAYGRDCPYLFEGCPEGNDPPTGDVQLVGDRLRYSYAGLFWLCPERYRREMIQQQALVTIQEELLPQPDELFEDVFEPPLLGTLLHAFMERIYNRIRELTT